LIDKPKVVPSFSLRRSMTKFNLSGETRVRSRLEQGRP
jgi:hypothetical protein